MTSATSDCPPRVSRSDSSVASTGLFRGPRRATASTRAVWRGARISLQVGKSTAKANVCASRTTSSSPTMSAAGDPDRRISEVERLDAEAGPAAGRRIELHASRDLDIGRRTQARGTAPPCRRIGRPPRPSAPASAARARDAPIAPVRAFGQSRVDEIDGRASVGGSADHVRPEFGFHEHEGARPHAPQEAPHRPRVVVGRVAVRHGIAEQSGDPRRTRRRHGRDQERSSPAGGA